jgi:mannose-6-phosphate isomerase-like protein (cupin superfamily)
VLVVAVIGGKVIDRRWARLPEVATDSESAVIKGEGYAVANLDDLGEGPGFRKIRKGLGVTAFGVNAIVLPPAFETGSHYHDEQEELYFLHSGRIAIEFGDGTSHELEPGGLAWVDASTHRKVRNLSDSEDAIYVVVGGKDGYVGRDGKLPEGETRLGAGPADS